MEEQLIEYWRSAGKEISILPEDEKEKMWDAIRKKYLRPGVHIGYSICDALNCSLASSMGGADSWRCIGDFMKEFYITDSEASFLLAYNEAQCLIAMGTAADWLEGYKARCQE